MAPPVKPPKDKLPSLHGRVMVDTFQGKVRIRAWPKKRGKPKSRAQILQIERFKNVQRMYPQLKGEIANRFIAATQKTGLYPRDLFMKMATKPPIEFETEDGRLIRHRRPFLEKVVFQGFAARLTANQSFPGTTLFAPDWGLPVIDTAGFFDPGSPSVITIPEGVAVMQFFGGWRRTSITTVFGTMQITRISPSNLIMADAALTQSAGFICATGPVPVAEGEVYAAHLYCNNASTTLADRTFFSGQILAGEI